jgi:hypothetical protein
MSDKKIKTMHIHGHKVDFYKGTAKNKKYKAIVDDKKTI